MTYFCIFSYSLSQIILTQQFVAIQFTTQFLLSNIYAYKDVTLTTKKSGVYCLIRL